MWQFALTMAMAVLNKQKGNVNLWLQKILTNLHDMVAFNTALAPSGLQAL